jgi:hypothetical protein
MFRLFLIRPSSGWIQFSEEPYKAIIISISVNKSGDEISFTKFWWVRGGERIDWWWYLDKCIDYLYLFQLMHLFNTTLIQCQLLKHLKITPTCFDH